MIHAHGCKVIQHYHGKIKQILPDFLEMRARRGCTRSKRRRSATAPSPKPSTSSGDKMALIGNIQYDDFRALTPEQMAEAVRAVLDECRGKRLILSPSAGPYESYHLRPDGGELPGVHEDGLGTHGSITTRTPRHQDTRVVNKAPKRIGVFVPWW